MKSFPLIGAILVVLAAVASADDYKDAVLRDRPFAYYRLGEMDNAQPALDEAGNNVGTFKNGVTTGAPGAIERDPENRAVSFERAKCQYVQLTSMGNFGKETTEGCTVEYWLKTSDFTDHQTIFGMANKGGFLTDFLGDIGYNGKQKRLRMYLRDEHENRYEANFYPTGRNIDLYDNSWHYVVQVYAPKSGPNQKVQFYIDGVRQTIEVEHKGKEEPVFANFNEPLSLGAMDLRGKEPAHLEGSLDEVAFYSRPLSPEQIAAHYRASGAGDHVRLPH